MTWNAGLYDEKHGFVAEYGESLLQYVPAGPGQRILDLGCGTGALTEKLSQLGGYVLGTDSSPEMIAKARAEHPHLAFQVRDALRLPWREAWDVIFSNAVFHWIKDHTRLLESIYRALTPGGILVCECGAQGNIAAIEGAFAASMGERGYAYATQFNFPPKERFEQRLRQAGFHIQTLAVFDRPTPLRDGREGLTLWVRQFYASELAPLPGRDREAVCERMQELLESALWNGTEWVADYRRLRAVAQKRGGKLDP